MTSSLTDTARKRCAELAAEAGDSGFDPAENWELLLGTLGSGNHFVEVTTDERDRVWAFLRSGSRGVGNRIAQRHIKVAQELCKRWWISLPDRDLAYLVEGTDEFWHYIRELRWAQHFALLNREEMMDRVLDCLAAFMGADVDEQERISSIPPRARRCLPPALRRASLTHDRHHRAALGPDMELLGGRQGPLPDRPGDRNEDR